MLVFLTINSFLVAGAIAISIPNARLSQMVGVWSDNLLEIATLSLGALVAMAYLTNPWLALFCLPPLLVLHRAVLVRQLEEAARPDPKTGLLNAAAWQVQAERACTVEAPRRSAGVLVVDLDHFKAVNDTHGHLAGDDVLAAVAGVLRAEVRRPTSSGGSAARSSSCCWPASVAGAGRGGGGGRADTAADRGAARRGAHAGRAVDRAGAEFVSVGCAVMPDGGAELRDLLEVADRALYAAKGAGRNAVRMGHRGRPARRFCP